MVGKRFLASFQNVLHLSRCIFYRFHLPFELVAFSLAYARNHTLTHSHTRHTHACTHVERNKMVCVGAMLAHLCSHSQVTRGLGQRWSLASTDPPPPKPLEPTAAHSAWHAGM